MNADERRWGRFGAGSGEQWSSGLARLRRSGTRLIVLAWLLAAFIGVHLRLLLPTAAAAAATPALKPSIFQYEVQVTVPNQAPRKMEQTIWMKGKRFRIEMTTQPTTIGGPDGVYLLFPGRKEAMKLPAQAAASAGAGSITPDIAKLRKQKQVGSEKVGRYKADIYEQRADIQMPGAPTKVKSVTRIWISRDQPVPVKTVSSIPGGFQTVSVLKSARVGATIADTLFVLPKGTKVRASIP